MDFDKIEDIVRKREQEVLARRDKSEYEKNRDIRRELGLMKVEGHEHLGRDPKSNAIVNTDKSGYKAYVEAREKNKLKLTETQELKNEVNELKEMLKLLVEKNDK